jgi:hypothetical protein
MLPLRARGRSLRAPVHGRAGTRARVSVRALPENSRVQPTLLTLGLSMVCEDEEMLDLTARLYDGLYEHRRRATLLGREPS